MRATSAREIVGDRLGRRVVCSVVAERVPAFGDVPSPTTPATPAAPATAAAPAATATEGGGERGKGGGGGEGGEGGEAGHVASAAMMIKRALLNAHDGDGRCVLHLLGLGLGLGLGLE